MIMFKFWKLHAQAHRLCQSDLKVVEGMQFDLGFSVALLHQQPRQASRFDGSSVHLVALQEDLQHSQTLANLRASCKSWSSTAHHR